MHRSAHRGFRNIRAKAAQPASVPGATGGPACTKDMVKIKNISSRVRQIAVSIGRDEPTLLITHDLATPARDLFARYAERMMVENELDA